MDKRERTAEVLAAVYSLIIVAVFAVVAGTINYLWLGRFLDF